MAKGIKVVPSVFVALIKDGQVFLIRRKNTGWIDGWYDLPAGHLEEQEHLKDGAVRELKEESGAIAEPDDLELIHVHQNHHNPQTPHYGYIFIANKWRGEPRLVEPEKSDDARWFPLTKLPAKLSPYVRAALKNVGSNTLTISYHPPGSIKH